MKTPQVEALPGMTPLGFKPNRFSTTPATSATAHYKIATHAFEHAIKVGLLSKELASDNYAGDFMYMGLHGDRLQFKNIVTRQYISCDWR